MPAGTIKLTNNSAAVTGTGTSFTTELAANDFLVAVVGGVTYTLGVKSVESNTGLTLAAAYNGPTTTGLAWTPVPNATLVGITAQVAADVAKAIRGMNLDKANWQQIFSGTGNITVTLPDGSQYSGPSWSALTDSLNSKIGSSGGEINGQLTISRGDQQILMKTPAGSSNYIRFQDGNNLYAYLGRGGGYDEVRLQKYSTNGFISINPDGLSLDGGTPNQITLNSPFVANGTGQVNGTLFLTAQEGINLWTTTTGGNCWIHFKKSNNKSDGWRMGYLNDGNLYIRNYSADNTTGVAALNIAPTGVIWTTNNTTRAADGTLKAASPVARIVKSQEESQRTDVNEMDFEWCGAGTRNSEAEGISITRMDTGVYVLTGSLGLAKEGWQLSPPRDPMGSGDMGIVEAEETESGGITVRLYKRKYMLSDDGEIVLTKGPLIDVPPTSWIDIRLQMPEKESSPEESPGSDE